jgi:hypothetical protein
MHVTLRSLAATLASYLSLTGGTMSGAIAMGSQLITGLAQATAAGHALRYEALGPGTLPTAALFPTAVTATNHTESFFASDDVGAHVGIASATAVGRFSGRVGAGSRIAGLLRGRHVSTGTTGVIPGGAGLVCARSGTDGKLMTMHADGATVVVANWTTKDAFSAARRTGGTTYGAGWPAIWGRIGESGANFVAEVSPDGVNWQTIYTAATATAWGSAGVTTEVGFGCMTNNPTTIASASLLRCTITP